MKIPKIMRALGFVDDELIEEAADQTVEMPNGMADENAAIKEEAVAAEIEATEVKSTDPMAKKVTAGEAKIETIAETSSTKAAESKQSESRRPGFSDRRKKWTAAVAAAAMLALVIGCIGYTYGIRGNGESSQVALNESGEALEVSDNPFVVVAAKYPAAYSYSTSYTENYPDNYNEFVTSLSGQMLTQDTDSNLVYSPLNIYLALTMLAETAGGDSREQILQALGNEDMDSLRTQASWLWEGNYRNSDERMSILASSLWLNQDLTYNMDTVNILAEKYYASVYQGPLGTEEFTNEMINWINEQTGDLLAEQADALLRKSDNESSEDGQKSETESANGQKSETQSDDGQQSVSDDENKTDVANLVTTIYYKARWSQEFSEELTSTDTFHGVSQDVECDFMHQTIEQDVYYEGEHFGAVFKYFFGGGGMWLILPDEDSSVSELLEGEELYELLDTSESIALYNTSDWENSRDVKLNLTMPKFDIVSSWNLKETLALLGITDVFDEEAADLSALTDQDAYIASIVHAARIIVDENGITAAAFTEMDSDSSAAPPSEELEELDFVLDRPFVYAVVSDTGTILFMGTVNQL